MSGLDVAFSNKKEVRSSVDSLILNNYSQSSAIYNEGLKPAISGNAAKISSLPSDERHSIILNKVKESGYCRLRDLQNIFPDVSERTIRYDLEKLVNSGSIERFGNGGPSTYYRVKR